MLSPGFECGNISPEPPEGLIAIGLCRDVSGYMQLPSQAAVNVPVVCYGQTTRSCARSRTSLMSEGFEGVVREARGLAMAILTRWCRGFGEEDMLW